MAETDPRLVDNLARALAEARALEAPLAARLRLFSDRLLEFGPHYAHRYAALVARLADARAGFGAPTIGDTLPAFALPDARGRLTSLAELAADGPLVVSFNRGHWCEFCRIELSALTEIHGQIVSRGAGAVAILPETAACLRQLQSDDRIPFPLLADPGCAYALSLGIALAVDDELVDMLRADGLALAHFQASERAMLPIPATYVVDKNRTILARHVDPDFRTRLSTEAILAAIGTASR